MSYEYSITSKFNAIRFDHLPDFMSKRDVLEKLEELEESDSLDLGVTVQIWDGNEFVDKVLGSEFLNERGYNPEKYDDPEPISVVQMSKQIGDAAYK